MNISFRGGIIIPKQEVAKLKPEEKTELLTRSEKLKQEGNIKRVVPEGKGGCIGLFFNKSQKTYELSAAKEISEEFGVNAYHYPDMNENKFKFITGIYKKKGDVKPAGELENK